MNEEKTVKCLRQMEYMRGHFWHIYTTKVLRPREYVTYWPYCLTISPNICPTTKDF